MRTFAADLGIVPSATIKYYRVMKRECVFKIEVEGWLWRVEREGLLMSDEPSTYWVMHRRRVYAKVKGVDARAAIETACRSALGCPVSISWGVAV